MKWSLDDVRIVGDIVVASLLARMAQLVALKAFVEPAGHFIGTSLWKRLRGLSGGRLPALPWASVVPSDPRPTCTHPQMHEALGRPVADAVWPVLVTPPLDGEG